jgi:hypothetical protein
LHTYLISEPNVLCCDICHPSLLDQTRPGVSAVAVRKKQLKKGLLNSKVQDELHEWRKSVWKRDFESEVYGPSMILSDSTLNSLASAGPISSLSGLEQVVGKNWTWFGQYGDELLSKLTSLPIPAVIPKPIKPRAAAKRAQEVADVENEEGGMSVNGSVKRRRTNLPTTPRVASSSSSRSNTVQHHDPTVTPVNHSQLAAPSLSPLTRTSVIPPSGLQPQPVYHYPMMPYPTTSLATSVSHRNPMYGSLYYPQVNQQGPQPIFYYPNHYPQYQSAYPHFVTHPSGPPPN